LDRAPIHNNPVPQGPFRLSLSRFGAMEEDKHDEKEGDFGPDPNSPIDKVLSEVKEINTTKPSEASAIAVDDGKSEYEYITGVKLFLVMASLTLVLFLMMLDMSIVVTVSYITWGFIIPK
jgi:hypothetical protein